MRAALLPGLTVLALLLPGCLDAFGPSGPDGDPDPVPAFDASIVGPTVDWWEDYSTRWIKRDAYLPMNDEAHEYLRSELEAAGFDVRIRAYPAREQNIDLPQIPPVEVHVVEATITGTEFPDRHIGLVTHFDTEENTFQGAYDNGSGTAITMSLCKALADQPLRHSLTCLFFDGEERGLVASDHYVEDIVVEGDEGFGYEFVIGYDMVGINWPGHDWKMYVMTGGADYVPQLGDFAERIMFEDLGYPANGVEVLDTHDRNSDERRFRDAGVPIFRLAGGRHAADYPQYHMPDDTVQYVYDFVDGRANFEAGVHTILEASWHLYLELDRTSWPEIASAA